MQNALNSLWRKLLRDGLSVPTRLKDATNAVCGDFETDEVVSDDVVDTRIAGGEGYTVLFALDGQQARAERLGDRAAFAASKIALLFSDI
ncbi:hypothetical protein [Nostoc sp. NZL]|uniref:hypothetical protein n=1 Tax=Nostoc sp. NZL TaxID=2650612 RepID=UPI001E440C8B|nr:hypothetical protein [Nostoc sp. NZL]